MRRMNRSAMSKSSKSIEKMSGGNGIELYNYNARIVFKVEKAPPKPPTSPCHGFYRYGSGPTQIHPEESQVVHFIFEQYLLGATTGKISNLLFEKNIPSPFGKPKLARNSIDNLLSNALFQLATNLPFTQHLRAYPPVHGRYGQVYNQHCKGKAFGPGAVQAKQHGCRAA